MLIFETVQNKIKYLVDKASIDTFYSAVLSLDDEYFYDLNLETDIYKLIFGYRNIPLLLINHTDDINNLTENVGNKFALNQIRLRETYYFYVITCNHTDDLDLFDETDEDLCNKSIKGFYKYEIKSNILTPKPYSLIPIVELENHFKDWTLLTSEYHEQIPIIWNEDALLQWYIKDAISNLIEKLEKRKLYFILQTEMNGKIKKTIISPQSANESSQGKEIQKNLFEFLCHKNDLATIQFDKYKISTIPLKMGIQITGKKENFEKSAHTVPTIRIEKVNKLSISDDTNNLNKSTSKTKKINCSPVDIYGDDMAPSSLNNTTNEKNGNFNENLGEANKIFMLDIVIKPYYMLTGAVDKKTTTTTLSQPIICQGLKQSLISQLQAIYLDWFTDNKEKEENSTKEQSIDDEYAKTGGDVLNEPHNRNKVTSFTLKQMLESIQEACGNKAPILTLPTAQLFWNPQHNIPIPFLACHSLFGTLESRKNERKQWMDFLLIPPTQPILTSPYALSLIDKTLKITKPHDNEIQTKDNLDRDHPILNYYEKGHLLNPHTYMYLLDTMNASFNKKEAKNKVIIPSQAFGPHVQTAYVSGNYAYYHYNQDGINDCGWGCAYRSLQTLASWLFFQGYVEALVYDTNTFESGNSKLNKIDNWKIKPPTHKEIQEALYAMGDKPKSFVGSTQWIGSNEVAYVLQHFYQIDSRILHVSNGSQIKEHHQTLLYHFQSQGTPVMIGGGELAHTILGLAYDGDKDETFFLILDPHYTGSSDDIIAILKNDGCYWKASNFWDKKRFYNLCMPQRPIIC